MDLIIRMTPKAFNHHKNPSKFRDTSFYICFIHKLFLILIYPVITSCSESYPLITLNGDSSIVIIRGQEYRELGAYAVDQQGQKLKVKVSGNINSDTLGNYEVTYEATDAHGDSNTKIRDIKVRAFRPFITTWKIDSEDENISIELDNNVDSFSVDWGDGTVENYENVSYITHDYDQHNEYKVSISGSGFTRINCYFRRCQNLVSVDQWGDIQWSTMRRAFYNIHISTFEIYANDSPNLSNVTDMSEMFKHTSKFQGDLSGWDVSNVANMSYMFYSADAFNSKLNKWDVSNVTDMSGMFYHAKTFNNDLNEWDVSSVVDMSKMFSNASAFNGDVSTWNVSNVRTMYYMFSGAYKFNRDIGLWDVSNVTTMEAMFTGALEFNQSLNTWNVSNVMHMNNMFNKARAFNGSIESWDVSNVVDMTYMFKGTDLFDGKLNNWNVSSVQKMKGMFQESKAFNGDIENWNVSNVKVMHSMFEDAEAFNKDISNWKISN